MSAVPPPGTPGNFLKGLSALIGLGFQTFPFHFYPFFRFGYGRRYYTLLNNVIAPFILLAVAFLLRNFVPHYVLYAPLYVIPPYGWDPEIRTLMSSSEVGAPIFDNQLFVAFAALLLAFSLFHYFQLLVRKLRKTDPTYTRFWGYSWLAAMPVLSNLSLPTIQVRIEPLIVFVLGYLLCAIAPVFGMFLMVGSIVFAMDEAADWRRARVEKLDARDALAGADIQQGRHEEALAHQDRVVHDARGVLSDATLARIQKNPHAMLGLDPEETIAARETLGSDRFGEICDQLPLDEQNAVYAKLRTPGLIEAVEEAG